MKYSIRYFNLFEAIVVITVLVILATLHSSVREQMKETSRGTICAGHLKQIGAAAVMYASDNHDTLPAGMTPYPNRQYRWMLAFGKYLSKTPESERTISLGFNKFPEMPIICPAAPVNFGFTYGANYCYAPNRNAKLPFYHYDASKPALSRFARYSKQLPEIMMIGDANNITAYNPRQPGCEPSRDLSKNDILDSAEAKYNHYAPDRHPEGMNFVRCDGAVRTASFEEWEENFNNSGWLYNENYDL